MERLSQLSVSLKRPSGFWPARTTAAASSSKRKNSPSIPSSNKPLTDRSQVYKALTIFTLVVGYKRKGKGVPRLISNHNFCPNFLLALIFNYDFCPNFPLLLPCWYIQPRSGQISGDVLNNPRFFNTDFLTPYFFNTNFLTP